MPDDDEMQNIKNIPKGMKYFLMKFSKDTKWSKEDLKYFDIPFEELTQLNKKSMNDYLDHLTKEMDLWVKEQKCVHAHGCTSYEDFRPCSCHRRSVMRKNQTRRLHAIWMKIANIHLIRRTGYMFGNKNIDEGDD